MRNRLWIPETHQESRPPTIHTGLSGYFHVQLINAETGLIKQELRFKNRLTNGCLDGIGSGLFSIGLTVGFNALAVGTGNSTPLVTNTSLDNELVRTTSDGGIADVVGSNSSPEYAFVRRTRVFTTAQANGNLRELGFFTSPSGGTLMNRSLFRDSAGNPTTIVKTSQDILVVIYEWRLSAPQNDQTGSLLYFNNTESSNWILRPQGVNQSTHWVIAPLSMGDWIDNDDELAYFSNSTFFNTRTGINTPAGSAGDITSVTPQTYIPGTYQRDVNYQLGILDGNLSGGISLFVFTPWTLNQLDRRYLYQMSFDPPLLKNNVRQIDFTIRYTWDRV